VRNSRIKTKEKKRKRSFGAKPERITPHMPLREIDHVMVNQKTSMKAFFRCQKLM
jgi:endonuclease/exonuclease/phosphatase family metal-dependent hydrolase